MITAKEIREQADAWSAVLRDFSENSDGAFKLISTADASELIFVGCGTSYYLSLCAASMYTGVTRERARALTASDVLLCPTSVFSNPVSFIAIPVSRSGTTSETLWATRYLKNELKNPAIALSCNPDSELVEISDQALVALEGAERSVVMTKSFTSMLLSIQLLAAHMAGDSDFESQLHRLPDAGSQVINNFESVAEAMATNDKSEYFIFLGQGPYYGLACEAMLKMKEMSLSISEAYHSMEFRHGPISIVNGRSLVVFLMSDAGRSQEEKILREVKKLGASTCVICGESSQEIVSLADYVVELGSGFSDYARLSLYMPVIQLLGYHRAVRKGLNPDNPRHLAQVVVLE